MKCSIVYASQTGNTALVAEAIRRGVGDGCTRFSEAGAGEAPREELVFVGYWVDKGTADQKSRQVLAGLDHQRVALFGTCGMGGAPDYYAGIEQRVAALLPAGCTLVGSFLCQGQMAPAVGKRYEDALAAHPQDARSRAGLENFRHALGHPDQGDLARAEQFARQIMEQVQSI